MAALELELTGKFMLNQFKIAPRIALIIFLLAALIQLIQASSVNAAVPMAVIIESNGPVITTEDGGTDTFTVRLSNNPGTAAVFVEIFTSDFTEGTPSPNVLGFSSSNWFSPRTVTVTGQDDDDIDGDVVYTISAFETQRSSVPASTISVTNLDNDTAAFIVSPTSGLSTTEHGGADTFTVRLSSRPTGNVAIAVSSNDTSEGTVSVSSLTFTPDNWNVDQTVTITGVNDSIDDGDRPYTIVLSPPLTSDPDYSGVNPPDVSVTNIDNDTAGFTLSQTSGLTTNEIGSSDSFTVKLRSQPTANVVIPLSSSDTSEATVAPTSLTFTTGNWNTPQTVTATGVDDDIDDGTVSYSIVLGTVTSLDSDYGGENPSDVTATNLDNDTAGFKVTPTSGLTTSEAGDSDTFTVKLESQPVANVVIPLSSSDTTEGTIEPSSLTFTTSNWNSIQTVVVRGVSDAVDDGDQTYFAVLSPASSLDSVYNGMNPQNVSVTNTDNDEVGITVSPTSGLTTNESGTTDTFTIVLNSQPTANVTIGLSSSNTSEGTVSPSSATFTASNWNTPRTVTATGVDDDVDDGPVNYSIITAAATSADGDYAGINPSNVSVQNADDDTAGITVNPTSGLITSEDGSADSFTIILNSQPTANVTIGLSSSDTTEGTVSPSSVTFTASNWDTPRTVTATGVNDNLADGPISYSIITAAASSADGNYSGVNPSNVAVENTDDDTPMIAVSPTSGLDTGEDGSADTFIIILSSQPTANVTVGLSSSDTSEGIVSPSSVTFTASNWDNEQVVTVTGVDDKVDDGSVSYTIITAPAVSNDDNYSGLNPANVRADNEDNDTAGISVDPISGLRTGESGATDTFTVVLDSEPTANVSIALSSSDTTEGIVSPTSLTFTPANWQTAQTVTVTGLDDDIDDGHRHFQIILAAATSADAKYNGIDPEDVDVRNNDNDAAGVTVNPTSGLVTSETGSVASFTVVLNSQPTGDVDIDLYSDNPTEGTVATNAISFDESDWNVPKTINITGQNDRMDDGDIAYTIVLDPVNSSDARYNNLNPDDVSVVNHDDDSAGVVVNPTSISTSENGSQASFTVVLTTKPAAGVSIGISSSDTTEGTVSPAIVIFNDTNWDNPHTVTVTGQDDDVKDGHIDYEIVLAAATSSDPNYNGLNPDNVKVTNVDNDEPGIVVNPTTGLFTSEGGSSAEFSIVLVTQPTASVAIPISTSDAGEGTVSSSTIAFTPLNWNVPKTVTIVGENDDIADGDVTFAIVLAPAVSNDAEYNDIDPPDVGVINIDNDEAGITVIPTTGLQTTEAGGSANFSIVLDSQPLSEVSISISSSDATEGNVTPLEVEFTDSNWDTPQTVEVVGVDDNADDGDVTYTIVLAEASSADGIYAQLDPDDVTVINLDDDETGQAGIEVTPQTGLVTDESGEIASFTVVLSNAPAADVRIPLSSSDETEGRLDVNELVFTPINWNAVQTVQVVGVDDAAQDGDVSYTILLGAATSSDAGYDGLNAPDVSVINVDNEEQEPPSEGKLFIPVILVNHAPLVNAGFETGDLSGWVTAGQMDSQVVSSIDTDGSFGGAAAGVLGGGFSAELNNPNRPNDNVQVGYAEIRQTITVPDNVTQLSFQYHIFTHDVIFSADRDMYFDTFEVYIDNTTVSTSRRDTRCRTDPGVVGSAQTGLVLCDGKVTDPTRNNPPANLGTKNATLDISSHAGQTIELIFRVYNRVDNKYNSWVYVDDIVFSP